jgi:hypothetical protein
MQLNRRPGSISVSARSPSRKGMITAAQLEQALEEQQLGVQRGRKKPRRLGVILSSLTSQ